MPNELISLEIALPVVTVFLSVYICILMLGRKEESLDVKLKRFTTFRISGTAKTAEPGIKELLTKIARLAPRKWSESLDKELLRGGIPLKGGEFLVLQVFLTMFFAIIGFLLLKINLMGTGLGLLGLIIPRVWVKNAQKRKKRLFNNQLADALLILANSLKAGFSLLQAMEMASQEMADPISGELKTTLKEMTYGTPTEDALAHFSERVGSPDLDLLVTAILIQRQVGGNLAEVLLNIHATIQDRIRIQQEIKTLTAQGRTSGYIIAALPFGIAAILTLINPDYLKVLIKSPIGWVMLACGLISQIIGFLIIRKIITIEV